MTAPTDPESFSGSALALSFAATIRTYVERSSHSYREIAEWAGLSNKTTISNWVNGKVKHPRNLQELLRVAQVLALTRAELDMLLTAAAYPSSSLLLSDPPSSFQDKLQPLLLHWAQPSPSVPAAVPTGTVPFQAIAPVVPLVGRTQLIQRLQRMLLRHGQICLLHGMAGVGKTVVAAQVAHQLRAEFPDGVLWAHLDRSAPLDILQSFAGAFGADVTYYPDVGTRSSAVRDLLARKRVLLIFDHVSSRDDLTYLLPPLLTNSAVLITSREQNIVLSQPPQLVEVPPFSLVESLAYFEHKLGLERVQQEQAALLQICHGVQGLPLALDLIAGYLRQPGLTTVEYLTVLNREQIRLADLFGDDLPRVIAPSFRISFDALSPTLQARLAVFALFAGGEGSVAALSALFPEPVGIVKRDLNQLVSRSLVNYLTERMDLALDERELTDGERGGNTQRWQDRNLYQRYAVHPLLCSFLVEMANAALADQPLLQARFIDYYVGFAVQHAADIRLLAVDWANIQRAMRWAAQLGAAEGDWTRFQSGLDALTTPRLGSLGFLDAQGQWHLAHHWLTTVLAAYQQQGSVDGQLRLQIKLGIFRYRLGAQTEAVGLLQEALAAFAAAPPVGAEMAIIGAYGYEALAQLHAAPRSDAALAYVTQATGLFVGSNSAATQNELGYFLVRRATLMAQAGELDQARALLEKALNGLLPLPPSGARVSGLLSLGRIYQLQGDRAATERCWRSAVEGAEAIGDNSRLVRIWRNLAMLADERGELTVALERSRRAYALAQQIGDQVSEGHIASNLAFTYLRLHDTAAASDLLDHTHAIAERVQDPTLMLHVTVNQARYCLQTGRFGAAKNALAAALAQSIATGNRELLSEIYGLQAQVALHNGDLTTALTLSNEAIAAAEDSALEVGIALRLQGNVLSAIGETNAAEALYAESLEQLATFPFDNAQTLLALAHHMQAVGDMARVTALMQMVQGIYAALHLELSV